MSAATAQDFDYAYINAYVKGEFAHIVVFRVCDGKPVGYAATENEARVLIRRAARGETE